MLVAWLTLLLLGGLALTLPAPAAAHTMGIHLDDTLVFTPNEIPVMPGESVSLQIENTGTEIHSFTLFLQVDADVPVTDFAALTAYNNTNDKIEVWLNGGETDWANFTAPTDPGRYTYVCMVLGHAASGMVGELIVQGETPPPGDGLISPLFIGIIVAVVAIVVLVVVFFVLRSRQ